MSDITYNPQRPYSSAGRIIVKNATCHFRLRASSWAMAVINMVVGLMMTFYPETLVSNPGADVYYARLLALADPEVWQFLFLFIGSIRLCALLINGTFPRFKHSPHIRACASTVSAIVWTQIAISVLATGKPSIGVILICSVVVVELFNTGAAGADTKLKLEGSYG